VRIIVLPFCAILSKISRRMPEVKLSNPDVGSSSTKTEGLVIASIAIHVLFLYPPDTPFIIPPPIFVF
jgi:hypothetical protein